MYTFCFTVSSADVDSNDDFYLIILSVYTFTCEISAVSVKQKWIDSYSAIDE